MAFRHFPNVLFSFLLFYFCLFVNSEPLKAQEGKTPARWRESEEEIAVEEEKEEEVVIILNRSTEKTLFVIVVVFVFYRGCHLFDFYDS